MPYINRKIEPARKTADASITASPYRKAKVDNAGTLEETGTRRSACHSAGTDADQTAHHEGNSSTLGGNAHGEKKNDK